MANHEKRLVALKALRAIKLNPEAKAFLGDAISLHRNKRIGLGNINIDKLYDFARRLDLDPSVVIYTAVATINEIAAQNKRDTIRLPRRHSEVIRYSNALIASLQEAISADSLRFHNRPPSELQLRSPRYVSEITKLIAELEWLVKLLKARKSSGRASTIKWGKHFNEFLHNYASALGKGLGAVTIATAAALLYQSGIGQNLIDQIWSHMKVLK
jgi:hypothetical protein